jgi:AraC-like DNA-binding protein
MFFRKQRPSPLLAEYIDYYWYLSDFPTHKEEHIIPSGTLEMVITLHDGRANIGAVVSGARTGHFVIDVRAHASIVGVHFKPGGAYPLLGVPPGCLTDQHVVLEAIWGTPAVFLRERLREARDSDARFRILDETFTRRLTVPTRQRGEVKFALQRLAKGNVSIGQVTAEVDLSRRHLIALFTEEVGLTPKIFGRVQRFQRAMSLATQDTSRDWAQLALACGYTDQSHLIRDFVSLSGLSPTALLQGHAGLKDNHAIAPNTAR